MNKAEAVRIVWEHLNSELWGIDVSQVFTDYDEMSVANQQRALEAMINVQSRLRYLSQVKDS